MNESESLTFQAVAQQPPGSVTPLIWGFDPLVGMQTGTEVIHDPDVITGGQQYPNKMAAHEPVTAQGKANTARNSRRHAMRAALVFPDHTVNSTWITLLADHGIINNFLMTLGVLQHPLPLLYNEGAVLLGLVYTYLPFMVLP